MPDLTQTQKEHAVELARGMLLAQTQQTPVMKMRTMLETPAISGLPHAQKLETLRNYAHMEDTPEYRNVVNVHEPVRDQIIDAAKNIAGDAAKTGTLGAAVTVLAAPTTAAAAIVDKASRKTVMKNLKAPMIVAALAGGLLRSIQEGQEALIRKENVELNQKILNDIRKESNPNPYINALMLSNAEAIRRAKLRTEDADDARELGARVVRDVSGTASVLYPRYFNNPQIVRKSLEVVNPGIVD